MRQGDEEMICYGEHSVVEVPQQPHVRGRKQLRCSARDVW
jgi:hypothetical protein